MNKKTPVAIFMAASALLAANALNQNVANAGGMGGTKEWNTDQSVNEKSKLDEDAKKQQKKAKQENTCIPIGEGENCW